jgi:hypothetical protein
MAKGVCVKVGAGQNSCLTSVYTSNSDCRRPHPGSPGIATILAYQSPEALKTPAVQTAAPIIAGSAFLPGTLVAETDGDGLRPSFTLKPDAAVVFQEHFLRL